VPKKPNSSSRQFEVGDKIRVSMHGGKIVDAVIKAILDTTDGLKYQIDFGKDQTATISERLVVKD
jgi:small-conductance mechanosensitive channel